MTDCNRADEARDVKIARDRLGPSVPEVATQAPSSPDAARVDAKIAEQVPGKLSKQTQKAVHGPSTRTELPPLIGRYPVQRSEHANWRRPVGVNPTGRQVRFAHRNSNGSAKMVSAHVKSRTEKPSIYPDRFPVADAKISWDTPFEAYAPNDFVAPVVLANAGPKGWADPESPKDVTRPFHSYTGAVRIDARGRPLNPMGRTGLEGRGLLGRWGANFAADPIVTRANPKTGELEMLAIRRKDSGEWAIPGGMVDEGEEISATLAREFHEETGVKLSMADAKLVFRGYADDPRNTDNAWMETTVKHKHLSSSEAATMEPKAGDDAAAVAWMPLNPDNVSMLYGNHASFVQAAIDALD
ncbi:MAG: NUDIX domain-containing protein [Deltaproteobacteria bacterium]|nr:NUDIX domain-containing protein [Deltaproteobacteria bacterium]